MAALDFPTSPIVGQVYSSGSKQWTWTGTTWVANNNNSKVIVSATAPAGAVQGTIWFNTTESVTYIYYNNQWVGVAEGVEGPAGAPGVDANSASLIGIRLSLDSMTPTSNTNQVDVGTVYVHPYKGGTIPLFSVESNQWFGQEIDTPLSFSLAGLAANTSYDIYLYIESNIIKAEFVAWTTNTPGTFLPPRAYKDTVAVKVGEPNKRLVGCIRTTLAGKSEQSFAMKVVGGGSPKQFLWNAQNQLPISCYNFDKGGWSAQNTDMTTGNTGWLRLNSGTAEGKNNRFSFLIGGNTPINLLSQIHAQPGRGPDGVAGYHTLSVNNEDSPAISGYGIVTSEASGPNINITSFMNHTFSPGYYFVQLFEKWYTGGILVEITDTGHGNAQHTGFTVGMVN